MKQVVEITKTPLNMQTIIAPEIVLKDVDIIAKE